MGLPFYLKTNQPIQQERITFAANYTRCLILQKFLLRKIQLIQFLKALFSSRF